MIRGFFVGFFFLGGQLPESTLLIKSNIPSLFKHGQTYLIQSGRIRKTPTFCAFEFCSRKDGTEKAWRA